MWSNGHAANEHGESVLLLLPIFYSNNKKLEKRKETLCPSLSHVGGIPAFHRNDSLLSKTKLIWGGANVASNPISTNPTCAVCRQQMPLLLQLHAPLDELDRTLYVFGCNSPSCHSLRELDADRFRPCFGGEDNSGAIRCFRSQQHWKAVDTSYLEELHSVSNAKTATSKNLEENDWVDGNDNGDGWGDDDDNDWGGKTNNAGDGKDANISMDDLESMLSQQELKSTKTTSNEQASKVSQSESTTNPSKLATQSRETDASISGGVAPSFTRYELEMIDEPSSNNNLENMNGADDDNEDDDDCDLGSGSIDSKTVDQMFSRYLEMEDDEEILSVLKGGGSKYSRGGESGAGKGGGGERYERLPPDERAFLAFSNRLRRLPQQVARYAYGGVPLWSIPLPQSSNNFHGKGKQNQQSKDQKHAAINKSSLQQKAQSSFPIIPPCACGAQRVFEVQLLPSVLHVLDVDSSLSKAEIDDTMDIINSGGMNWGSIAVYSCPESCDQSREEFVIVQESVDKASPKAKLGPNANDRGSDDEYMNSIEEC